MLAEDFGRDFLKKRRRGKVYEYSSKLSGKRTEIGQISGKIYISPKE